MSRVSGPHLGRAKAGPLTAALLAAGLLIGVGTVALHDSSHALLQDAQDRVQSNRDSAIRAINRQANDLKLTISTYASEPAIVTGLQTRKPADVQAAIDRMAVLARSKRAPAVVLSDLRGRNLAIYPPEPKFIGLDFSFRDWFQGARRTGGPYVSSAYPSVAPGHPLVVGISTPVLAGKTRVGYLTIVGQLDAIKAVAQGAQHDDGVVITITDQTGRTLIGSPRNATRQALAGRNANVIDASGLESAGPVPGIGWSVTAFVPTSVALAPQRSFRNSLDLTLGICLLLLVIWAALALRTASRRAIEQDIIEVERARLTALFAASPICILECYTAGIVVSVNDALSAMLGYEVDELVGTRGADLLEPSEQTLNTGRIDGSTRERRYVAKVGALVPTLTSVIVVRENHGEIRRVVSFVVDQRQQKRIESALRASEDRLTQLALHDDLTGLPNRRLLLQRCTAAFEMARTAGVEGSTVAALFIDLDGFKPVNDLQGHERGDQLLVEIAEDLLRVVRPGDTVARVGGDEFVVLLSQYDGLDHLNAAAERINKAVRRRITDGHISLPVTASVGVATVDLAIEPDARPDQLLSRADSAMYRAKEHGRDRYDIYDERDRALVDLPPPRAVLY